MDYRERGSHARGVHPTQYTSHLGTARMKQEGETDTRIMQESSKKSGNIPKQCLTSDNNLTIEFPKGREYPYHRLE